MTSLTTNAISKFMGMSAQQDDPSFQPTVQVIHVKKIDAKNGEDRYKVG